MTHHNSLLAWYGAQDIHKGRRNAVLGVVVKSHPVPVSARDILHKLFPYSDDLNKVRPRITELKKDGWIEEHDAVKQESGQVQARFVIGPKIRWVQEKQGELL